MDETSPSPSRRETLAAVLYCLSATVLFLRGPLLLRRYYHVPYDLEDFHHPLLSFVASSLREFGSLPWWNPYSYMGEPFFGNVQAAIFYPPTLLTVLAANAISGQLTLWWATALLAAHVVLAGVGTYRLLRALDVGFRAALAGATIYQLGAFFAAHLQHLGAICVAAWLPWSLWAVRRLEARRDWGSAAVAGLSFALMVLAGFPPAWLPALFFLPLFYAWWMWQRHPRLEWKLHARAAGLLVAVGCLGLMLSAVSWLPGKQVTEQSVAGWRYPGQALEGLPLEALTSLFWPNLFNQLHGSYWHPANPTQMHLYQGIPALLLVFGGVGWLACSAVALPFLVSAAIAALWMFGLSFPMSSIFYLLYPGAVRRGIYPWVLLAYFSLFFAVLASLSLNAWERGERSRLFSSRLCRRLALAALVIALLVCMAGTFAPYRSLGDVRASNAGAMLVVVAVALWVSGLLARVRAPGQSAGGETAAALHRASTRARVAAALCGLILFDLLAVGSHTQLNTLEEEGARRPDQVEWLADRLGPRPLYRIDTTEVGYNWQTKPPHWRLPSANGMNPLLLKDVVIYRAPFSRLDDRQFSLALPDSPLLDLAGVRYVVTQRSEMPGMQLVYRGDPKIFENRNAFPRYFLVGAAAGSRDVADAVRKIHTREVDASRMVVVPDSDLHVFAGLPGAASSQELGTIEELARSPNEIRLRVHASRPAALVITDTYWPDWRATLDGTSQPLVRGDALFRAMPVPAGSHQVRMVIVPSRLYAGAALSLTGLVLTGCCLLGYFRRPYPAAVFIPPSASASA